MAATYGASDLVYGWPAGTYGDLNGPAVAVNVEHGAHGLRGIESAAATPAGVEHGSAGVAAPCVELSGAAASVVEIG